MKIDDLNDDHRHWLRRERFKLMRATDLLSNPEQVRNTVGVYIFLIAGLDRVLRRAGFPEQEQALVKWSFGEYRHAYTGRSAAMRSRAIHHLAGEVRDSGVRQNLLALQFCYGVLWEPCELVLDHWETRLTHWILENSIVAFRPCERVGEVALVEAQLIARLPSPFNTEGNRSSPLTEPLAQMRAQFWAHVRASGQLRPRKPLMASKWLLESTRTHLPGLPSRHMTNPRS